MRSHIPDTVLDVGGAAANSTDLAHSKTLSFSERYIQSIIITMTSLLL